MLIPGSKANANSNSKKIRAASSGKKPTVSSSSQKAPSGKSKKKSSKDKTKEQMLHRYGWMYVGILFALVIVPLVVRNHLVVQCVSVSCMWTGLYWFCTVVDRFIVSSHK